MSWITKIFAWPLKQFYLLTGSYGIAIMLFAVMVNLILLPFMAKSKKSMMRTTRLQPKMKELERKYNGNPQQYQQAVSKLYKEEKINPMSGCLWMLIPYPILIALYSVIRQPLSKMMELGSDAVSSLTEWVTSNAGYVASTRSVYAEIDITNCIHQNWDAVTAALGDFSGKLMNLDYSFLGMNLGQQPSIKFWAFDWSNKAVWLPALGLFLIPVLSAFLSWLSMKISTMTNPQVDKQQAKMNGSMSIVMPLISLWICFSMPAALGVYWILNSVCGIIRDVILTKIYTKKLDLDDLAREEREREQEILRRREETERMKAAGETSKNPNTSKKKIQANQKQQDEERKAALEREERAAKRERLGIKEAEQPASQVGNRRYARGRAYAPERFGELSETPVDETVEEIVSDAVESAE